MQKINESFYYFETLDPETEKSLTVFNPVLRFNPYYQMRVRMGQARADCKESLYYKYGNGFVVPTGFLEFLNLYEKPKRSISYYKKILKIISKIKSFDPYKYQKLAVCDALYYKRLLIKAATGSGKSYIISLISKILLSLGYRGIIIVPNIMLTTQLKSDFESYGFDVDTELVGGKNNQKLFNKPLTISTWQSCKKITKFKTKDLEFLKDFDFVIVDECHKSRANELRKILEHCENAKYRIGLTGTIPKEAIDKMKLIGNFGMPKTYISSRELIDSNLGTEIEVNIIKIKYKSFACKSDNFQGQLSELIKYEPRNILITNFVNKLNGNTVLLFQRTEHGLNMFHKLLRLRNIEFNLKNSHKNFDFQTKSKIYFINGSIDGEIRERIRKILESDSNSILVANFACLSTGVNIKSLKNIVLASPTKSYITITQSIGRIIRLHNSKDISKVYDFGDLTGFFKKYINERIRDSYKPEGFKIIESQIEI
nr:MAG TPA: DNA helicase [Caudoviricetes sp.]